MNGTNIQKLSGHHQQTINNNYPTLLQTYPSCSGHRPRLPSLITTHDDQPPARPQLESEIEAVHEDTTTSIHYQTPNTTKPWSSPQIFNHIPSAYDRWFASYTPLKSRTQSMLTM